MPTGASIIGVAASGPLRLTPTQIHGTCTSTPLAFSLRMSAISRTAFPSAASPSRALRSLPLSVMMTGYLDWGNGLLGVRGTHGYFWSSTPYTYTNSLHLFFNSTSIYPKAGSNKPYGFMLRCVARFTYAFSSRALRSLPLSVMVSGYLHWVSGTLGYRGTNGHFWTSTPAAYTGSRYLDFNSTEVYPKGGGNKSYGVSLRCVAFQSSPQPSSFGYDVGLLRLAQRQFRLGHQEWAWRLLVIYALLLHVFTGLVLLLN